MDFLWFLRENREYGIALETLKQDIITATDSDLLLYCKAKKGKGHVVKSLINFIRVDLRDLICKHNDHCWRKLIHWRKLWP